MNRTLKVFASGPDRRLLAEQYPIVESYRAFVLFEVPPADVARLSRKYLVEDITSLYSVRVAGRKVGTLAKRSGSRARPALAGARREKLGPGPHHYLVEFIGPIKQAWLAEVRRAGGEPRAPYQHFTYVVRATGPALARIEALRCVRGVAHLPYRARIATSLREKTRLVDSRPALPRTRVLPGTYTVEFFGAGDARRALRSVKRLGLRILSSRPSSKFLVVRADDSESKRRRQIDKLSKVHGVRSVRERAIKRTSNDVAARILGTHRALSRKGLGLSGKGEVVAVCDSGLDTGEPDTIHPDFHGRIVGITSYPITEDYESEVANPGADDGPADRSDGHGTHVAGSVLGSGEASRGLEGVRGPIRGLAYEAKLFFQAVEQEVKWLSRSDARENGRWVLAGIPADVRDLFSDAHRRGARIHTNSWGGGDPGAYDTQCEQLDRFVWDHRDFCILVAAGNDGEDVDGQGRIAEMSVTSPATAKNCITVGGCENERPEFRSQKYGAASWWPDSFPVAPFKSDPMADDSNQVMAFSSRGPTLDGQIKPDVVAPGTFILSTRSTQIPLNDVGWGKFAPSRLYFHLGGTSMATPLVAGAVAVLRQYLRRRRRIARPSAALLKAALVASAERIGNAQDRRLLYDIHQGFGRVDVDRILAPTRPVSATFVDRRRGLHTGDLWQRRFRVKSSRRPLRLVMAYSDYPGRSLVNNLNLIVTDPAGRVHYGNANQGHSVPEVKNNVEVVHVERPTPGEWSIAVAASSIPHGPQPFALVGLGAFGSVPRWS